MAPREAWAAISLSTSAVLDMPLVEQRLVTEQQTMTFRLAADAKAAQGAEAADFRQWAVGSFIKDRSRQRMA